MLKIAELRKVDSAFLAITPGTKPNKYCTCSVDTFVKNNKMSCSCLNVGKKDRLYLITAYQTNNKRERKLVNPNFIHTAIIHIGRLW